MTLQQFLLILRARWFAALLTLIVTVAATVVVSLIIPKQFTASSAVVLDVKSPDPVSGIPLQGLIAPATWPRRSTSSTATASPSAWSSC